MIGQAPEDFLAGFRSNGTSGTHFWFGGRGPLIRHGRPEQGQGGGGKEAEMGRSADFWVGSPKGGGGGGEGGIVTRANRSSHQIRHSRPWLDERSGYISSPCLIRNGPELARWSAESSNVTRSGRGIPGLRGDGSGRDSGRKILRPRSRWGRRSTSLTALRSWSSSRVRSNRSAARPSAKSGCGSSTLRR